MEITDTLLETDDGSTDEDATRDASDTSDRMIEHATAESSTVDTDGLITLVRRAPALAALSEQPLDRRDLQTRLDVSKPTIHRLTHTLGEKGLIERSDGTFVLTKLGKTVATVVAEFTRSVATAYRLEPLLETLCHRHPSVDIEAFADATVTSAGPGDPYHPVRRYYALIEDTDTLRGFDMTTLPPEYLEATHRQVRDGMETAFIYGPDVAARLITAHPERVAALLESDRLDLRVHPTLPHGLAIFDDRIGIASYCETTGALRAFIDTDSPAAREWATRVYEEYRAEAIELTEHPELGREPCIRAVLDGTDSGYALEATRQS